MALTFDCKSIRITADHKYDGENAWTITIEATEEEYQKWKRVVKNDPLLSDPVFKKSDRDPDVSRS